MSNLLTLGSGLHVERIRVPPPLPSSAHPRGCARDYRATFV